MREGYEVFELNWQGQMVEVSYQANWLNTGHWHIELRCADRLPVTETRYRSYFVPMDCFADQADITACVIAWLDAAADTPAWRTFLADSRQLRFF